MQLSPTLLQRKHKSCDDARPFKAKILKNLSRAKYLIYTFLPNDNVSLAVVPSYCQHEVGQYIGIKPQVDNIILLEKKLVGNKNSLI